MERPMEGPNMEKPSRIQNVEWEGDIPLKRDGKITGWCHGHDRWIELDGEKINCGRSVEVLLPGGWTELSVELGREYYFPEMPELGNPVGLIARWPERGRR